MDILWEAAVVVLVFFVTFLMLENNKMKEELQKNRLTVQHIGNRIEKVSNEQESRILELKSREDRMYNALRESIGIVVDNVESLEKRQQQIEEVTKERELQEQRFFDGVNSILDYNVGVARKAGEE